MPDQGWFIVLALAIVVLVVTYVVLRIHNGG